MTDTNYIKDNNDNMENLKLNQTDLEVLNNNILFFPVELLTKPAQVKNSKLNFNRNFNNSFNNSNTNINTNKSNISIKPISRIRSGARGVGMKLF
jgi:hypothetical protein